MEKFKKITKYCPIWCIVFYAVATLCLILNIISLNSVAFSDWFNGSVSAGVRFILAKLTGWVPFSLGETLVISMPIVAIFLLVRAIRLTRGELDRAVRYLSGLLAICTVFYSLFVLTFSTAYRGTTLDVKLGLTREKVSAEELKETADILLSKANELADRDITYLKNGSSDMVYSLDELNDKLNVAYASACEKYSFIQSMSSNVKEVALSELMSYTHITGVYTYFTGEANINYVFPDYTIPFTMAHEMAHQRGIAREDEANFVAFLVCLESDDPYILYSAYLNMYEYVSSALYSADKELYKTVSVNKSARISAEQVAFNEFFAKYRDSVASNIADSVNDAYLKDQGQASGTKSYGLVVDLAVAYYK